MTITLLILGFVAAANPSRVAAAAPERPSRDLLVTFGATFLGATFVTALLGGPLLDLIDITGPSARIAAGIALLVVALKDVILRPPQPEPALAGSKAGVVPLAFPVAFTPAVALLSIAGAADRGVAVAVGTAVAAVVIVAAVILGPKALRSRVAVSTLGAAGAGIAALVVLDGVYAI